jgi:hypothetical protein
VWGEAGWNCSPGQVLHAGPHTRAVHVEPVTRDNAVSSRSRFFPVQLWVSLASVTEVRGTTAVLNSKAADVDEREQIATWTLNSF